MAVYTPALMLQDGGADRREPSAIRSRSPTSSLKACLGIGALGRGGGRLPRRADCALWERLARRAGRRCSWSLALPLDRRDRLRARRAVDRLALVARARRARRRHEPLRPRRRRGAACSRSRPSRSPGPIRSRRSRWEEDWRVDAGRARARRGARQGLGRRHGAAARRRAPRRRLVALAPRSPAAAASSSSPPPARPPPAGPSAPPAPAATSAPPRPPRSASPPATDARR